MKKLDSFIRIVAIFLGTMLNHNNQFLWKILNIWGVLKLNIAALHYVMLVIDSPNKICPYHWSQAIHPPTYKHELNLDDKAFLGPLLEWLQPLVVANIDARRFEEKTHVIWEIPTL